MHWAQAELQKRGFQIQSTPVWGADFVATLQGRAYAVRTQLNGPPSVPSLLELEGGRRYLDCQACLFLFTGSASPEVARVATKLEIGLQALQLSAENLWPWLSEQRGELPEEVLREVLERVLRGDSLSREQLNDLAGARSSSALIALLTQIPDIEFSGYPAGLRLRSQSSAGQLDLRELGYQGFHSVRDLMRDASELPLEAGTYAVEWEGGEPDFLARGSGGFSKGDPNVAVSVLRAQWTPGASILYVGKAGASGSKATLRSRIKQLLEFGQGKPAKHYGGRYLWQLRQAADLRVAWKVGDPNQLEQEVLAPFFSHYGRLPFANLQE